MNGAVRLRTRMVPKGRLPGEGRVESFLMVELARALTRGPLGVLGVVVRERVVELVELPEAAGVAPAWLLAGLTSTVTDHGAVEAVGLWGVLRRGSGAGPVSVAAVYLEWPDCRWWMWEARVGADGRTLDEASARERSAELGDPMPGGIGRWWTAARRTGVRLRLSPAGESPHVH